MPGGNVPNPTGHLHGYPGAPLTNMPGPNQPFLMANHPQFSYYPFYPTPYGPYAAQWAAMAANPYLAPPPIPPGTLGDPNRHMDAGKYSLHRLRKGGRCFIDFGLWHYSDGYFHFQFPMGLVKIQWSRLIHFKARLLIICKMLNWPPNTSMPLTIPIRIIFHSFLQVQFHPMQPSQPTMQLHNLPALFQRLIRSLSLQGSPIIQLIFSSTHSLNPIPFHPNHSQLRYSRRQSMMSRQRWRLQFSNKHRPLCLKRLSQQQRNRIHPNLLPQQRMELTLMHYDPTIRHTSPISYRRHHRPSTLYRHSLRFYHRSQSKQLTRIIIIIIMVSIKHRRRLSMRYGHIRRRALLWIFLNRLRKLP